MKFIDEVTIDVCGGRGGDGIVHWHREKYMPKGGPDGGNGGHGGAVIFFATTSLNTLIDLSFSPKLNAPDGKAGRGNNQHGACAKNLRVPVPVGTQFFYQGSLVADLNKDGAHWIAARGGRGGLGNTVFKNPGNRSPNEAIAGSDGEHFVFKLTLKSLADVGLLGFPNAGKSSFIAKVSSAKPRIADYPFSTLEPHLGVVSRPKGRSFIIADIPGIIKGASAGKGLGIKFLRHIERTKILAQFIDVSTVDDISTDARLEIAKQQFESISEELEKFSGKLAERPRVIVFSKMDLKGVAETFRLFKKTGIGGSHPCIAVSSIEGSGIDELLNILEHYCDKHANSKAE